MLAHNAQCAKEAELRELCEEIKKMENERKRPAVQFDEPGEEAKPHEGCNVEVDGEADICKKLHTRKKRSSNSIVKIEQFKDVVEDFAEKPKEKLQQELVHIEQRRNDLLPEHEKMQQRSQKVQGVLDKLLQCRNIRRSSVTIIHWPDWRLRSCKKIWRDLKK